MAPRMGVIATSIAIAITLVLGVTITTANTSISGLTLGGFEGTLDQSETFSEQAGTSSCTLADDAVTLEISDGTTTTGSFTGKATVDGCTTSVNGTVSATATTPTTPEV